ncbi:hypothetical protein EV356DRAFT_563924 [Viridothelium virens]|uniref:Uncharacterized protein n=1 Tax=Viridothelium virens TaxID=1048519 RepID=A0A6A6HKT9_VIRVR|nr:hypothetical protein EV356DRAFT_563924 [Viridothelium virens]
MRFVNLNSIVLLFSVSLLAFVTGAPHDTFQNTSDVRSNTSYGHGNIYFGNRTDVQVSPEEVIHFLENGSFIEWKPAGNGHVVDISEQVWQMGIQNVSSSKNKRAKRNVVRRSKKGGKFNIGHEKDKLTALLLEYASNIACFDKGSKMFLHDIDENIVTACNYLIGDNIPRPAVNFLRLWNTTDIGEIISDVKGKAGFLSFGMKLLTNKAPADFSLCTMALNSFNNYCEGHSNTQGGQVTVGDSTIFSADPVDLGINN